ncbi:MAG TPA: cytochrome c [Bryobacteraceae bacterium]
MHRLHLSSAFLFALTVSGATDSATFNKDVLPIVQKNCQACHRPGEAAPFSLLTFESARPWAKAIKAAVVSKKMPPWQADPKYGHFLNDPRLSEADVRTIASWVDAGAPEGDAHDKPAPIQWRDGWNIRPDLVIPLPKPYTVPAKAVIPWLDFVVPTNFTKDTWVAAGEIRPGSRGVVHHATITFVPPGPESKELEALATGEPVKLPRGLAAQALVALGPGAPARRFDDYNAAVLVPAGSFLIFNMHYTSNGTETSDQSKLGLELAATEPKNQLISVLAGDDGSTSAGNLKILPGDASAPGHGSVTFAAPVKLASLNPHMHLRGKDFVYRLVYPTGESEIILNVPKYDYAWQPGYRFEKMLELPAGTRLEMDGHWDNSPNNPNNPDPTATVRWGQQIWEEMFGGGITLLVPRGTDAATLVKKENLRQK